MTSKVKSDLRFEIYRLDNLWHLGSKGSNLLFLTNDTGRKEAKTDLLTCMASPQVKTGRMAGTGQGGRFSLSGRHSAIENGKVSFLL